MKIFEKNGKINFVDANNVLVGFGWAEHCCESFDYFLSTKLPNELNDPAEEINPDGFNFDTKFFHEGHDDDLYCGGMVTFRLTKGNEEIFLTLYNSHNGYYSHGFEMNVGGVNIFEGSL